MLVLALDVGTSSTRAQCFDDRGRPLPRAGARVGYEAAVTADGGVELAADADALRQRLDEDAVHARTGAPIHSTFYPARLCWLRRVQPAVFERAALWCGFAEYVALRLTGRLGVSVSMASGTGLLDHSTEI